MSDARNKPGKITRYVRVLARSTMRSFKLPVLIVTYLYLLRFPLLTVGVLLLLPLSAFSKTIAAFLYEYAPPPFVPAAAVGAKLVSAWVVEHLGADALLRGLFDITGSPWHVLLVTMTAFMVSWVALTSYRVVSLYGNERFNVQNFGVELPHAPAELQWYHRLLFTALPLPLVIGIVAQSSRGWREAALNVGAAAAGWCVSLLLLALAVLMPRVFFVTGARPASPSGALLERRLEAFFVWVAGRLRALLVKLPLAKEIHRPRVSLPVWLSLTPQYWGCGILQYKEQDGRRCAVAFKQGHGIAFLLGVWGVLIYAACGVWVQFFRLDARSLPPLLYVMLLLIPLCWVLSMLAFFLDCYRIPILLPLLLWLALTSTLPWSDYYYPVLRPEPPAVRSAGGRPAAVAPASPAARRRDESIIVVAANGGGIQSAAWAARVLTGLELKCREEMGGDCRFGESVRLVSAVSGGSVGAMYFVNEYADGRLPGDAELEKIVERAKESSLGAAAWGLAYPDFLRMLIPLPIFENDRGRALEEAWLRAGDSLRDEARRRNLGRGLGEWRRDTEEGKRPGLILNATNGDSGSRLPLTTVALPQGSHGRGAFDEIYDLDDSVPRPDIPVVTAARLSASFPYVSPAARADLSMFGGRGAAHIVDGGYYDNYGISSLIEWLDDELERNPRVKRVLILQIRGASSYVTAAHDQQKICREAEDFLFLSQRAGRARGWLYQAFAPLSTLLKVRDTGQLIRNDVEINLLKDKWGERRRRRVDIYTTVFEFKGADPPLSWHLTPEQKEAIEDNWRAEAGGCNDPESETEDGGLNVKYGGWPAVRNFLTLTHNMPAGASPLPRKVSGLVPSVPGPRRDVRARPRRGMALRAN